MASPFSRFPLCYDILSFFITVTEKRLIRAVSNVPLSILGRILGGPQGSQQRWNMVREGHELDFTEVLPEIGVSTKQSESRVLND